MNSYQITSIGHIISPYKEKFAVPRQPGLVPGWRRPANTTHTL
ncbi:Uncharacterised protein [Proteus mirabilis]|uniref:TsaA-like domain-containing protein n=1 Tax=Proteus mirabilis TaxID=584 RepID=A0A379GB77_PROMI|nr:Uncharacterised protein [Proteus mirabilis]